MINQALFFALQHRVHHSERNYFIEEILNLFSFYRLPRALSEPWFT
jgi:hypothetical protein